MPAEAPSRSEAPAPSYPARNPDSTPFPAGASASAVTPVGASIYCTFPAEANGVPTCIITSANGTTFSPIYVAGGNESVTIAAGGTTTVIAGQPIATATGGPMMISPVSPVVTRSV
jgi:hypothetical protein